MSLDAIVLCGGRSARLGGESKAALQIDGVSLLELTLRALLFVDRIVAVGETTNLTLPAGVIRARENPPFGGPVAAIEAGLRALGDPPAEWILVLACDMPRVSTAVEALLAERSADGALAVDGGRDQPLAAIYRTTALTAALAALPHWVGMSMRVLLAPLRLARVTVPPGSTSDVDTWDDAAALGASVSVRGAR